MRWIARTAFGLEGLAAEELRQLHAESVTPLATGGVLFEGTADMAFTANLWLRTADRVLLVVAEGDVTSYEDLYQLVSRQPWEQLFPKNAAFPVRAHCARSILMSPSDCQAITKKAVCVRMSKTYRIDWLPETGSIYQIDVTIHGDHAMICLDSSGEALNRRGYRTWNGEAPLRETLAAAILQASPWRGNQPLLDPMCGTGTIAIEAAMIAAHCAPGIKRTFAMEQWDSFHDMHSSTIRADAEKRLRERLTEELPVIAGSDISEEPLTLAKRHLAQSPIGNKVQFIQCDAANVIMPADRGVIVVNPPYGERLGDEKYALQAARILGNIWKNNPGWTVCALSSVQGFEKAFGHKSDKRRRFYNGRIECEFMIFTCQNLAKRNGGKNR